jgi:hypothetical protein
MKNLLSRLPLAIVIGLGSAFLVHGPIVQPLAYHDFADRSSLVGLPHATDVLSNIGFALVGLWGFVRLRPQRDHAAVPVGWYGYRLFLLGLTLTGAGSWFYHLAPDDVRLVWDRLPIALACVGLLAAVRAETQPVEDPQSEAAVFALAAVVSVAWWHFTGLHGTGDLRPYLLLQILPLLLIPIWQSIEPAPMRDRVAFGIALLVYVAAKVAETQDHQILELTGWISGHTLKHLLATLAAAIIVDRLIVRLGENRSSIVPAPHVGRGAQRSAERAC